MNKIPVYEGMHGNTKIPNIFDEIADLDLKYSKYIQCTNIDPVNNGNLNCTDDDKNIENINKSIKKLNVNLNEALNTNKISKDDYNKNLNNIIQKHKDIVKLRNELDMKSGELNKLNDPFYRDFQAKYDASVYSGVLWSILASSLLYYVFTKL